MFLPAAKAALTCRTEKESNAPTARWPPCNRQTYSRNLHSLELDCQSAASTLLPTQPTSLLQSLAAECFRLDWAGSSLAVIVSFGTATSG